MPIDRLPTLSAVAIVGAAALVLAACGSSSSGIAAGSSTPAGTGSTAALSTPAASSSSSTTTSAPVSSSAAATSGAATPVAVNKSFVDAVMGDKATVLKYIRGYTPSAAAKQQHSSLADEDVVLVDLKVTASTKYYDSFGADSFYLTGTTDGIDQASTTILDDDIKAAGYAPLPDADTGKTTTGWVVFTPQKGDMTTLLLRYKRLAAGTSDGKNITAKNFDTPLGS
jgi:hypothetical protein